MNKKGKIFIISAPSGCGKTTLCQKLMRAGPGLTDSISMTTRPRRPGERNGRDYYFVSRKYFQKCIKQDGFLEWTKTYGWYYGTPRAFVEKLLKNERDVLLSIDVKGAMNVKRSYPDAALIFVLPPSVEELRKRLQKRNLDDKKEITKRLRIVKRELSYAPRYDYNVVNDNVNSAVAKLKTIIAAEKLKRR